MSHPLAVFLRSGEQVLRALFGDEYRAGHGHERTGNPRHFNPISKAKITTAKDSCTWDCKILGGRNSFSTCW